MHIPEATIEPTPPTSKHVGARSILAVVERITALGLALLFLRSAFAHLGNPYYFLSSVYSYQLTSAEVGKWLVLILPFAQMVVAVCLLTRTWTGAAYGLAFLLLVVFAGAQFLALRRGLAISCGCFGAADTLQVGAQTVLVTCLGMSAALVGLFCSRGSAPTAVEP